jgi:hypothetical protein
MSGNINNLNTIMSKLQIPAASYLMELAAIDWFKDTKRMDNVARQKGCVAQVTKSLSLLSYVVVDFLLKVVSSFPVTFTAFLGCCRERDAYICCEHTGQLVFPKS